MYLIYANLPQKSFLNEASNVSFSKQQQMRANVSGASFPNELRDLLQSRLGDLESQLLKKVNELEEEKSQLYNETAAHRQQTENTLSALMNRIKELEKGSPAASHSAL